MAKEKRVVLVIDESNILESLLEYCEDNLGLSKKDAEDMAVSLVDGGEVKIIFEWRKK